MKLFLLLILTFNGLAQELTDQEILEILEDKPSSSSKEASPSDSLLDIDNIENLSLESEAPRSRTKPEEDLLDLDLSSFENQEKQIVKDLLGDEPLSAPKPKMVEQKDPPPSLTPRNEFNELELGQAEQKLLEAAKTFRSKMTAQQWRELTAPTRIEKYQVVKGDTLWDISQRLFGSGFFYAKIWALNPYITNPHQIEPGMVLLFNTGDGATPPTLALGKFENIEVPETGTMLDFERFGGAKPPWIDQRKDLMAEGNHFQFTTRDTLDDLVKESLKKQNTEYRRYRPPMATFNLTDPDAKPQILGLDEGHVKEQSFKEGFSHHTFISTNLVQDFGVVEAAAEAGGFKNPFQTVFVRVKEDKVVGVGEQFSLYHSLGLVERSFSDRKGFRYTIAGHLRLKRLVEENLWEAEVFGAKHLIERGKSRLTVYTPKIERMTQTFNSRLVEAAVVQGYNDSQTHFSFGDIVYLDRGRVDGLEVGNVLNAYSSQDKRTEKTITVPPTYKIGEATVVTLTDDFATAVISQSSGALLLGTVLKTKTQEEAARDTKLAQHQVENLSPLGGQQAAELDVALNIDDLSQNILDRAKEIKLSQKEQQELDRLQREQSFLVDQFSQDRKALEKIEEEIMLAENQLKQATSDKDRLLEDLSLNTVEQDLGEPADVKNINQLESELGRRYMESKLNAKENPYGLTEEDIERVDELLDPLNRKKRDV